MKQNKTYFTNETIRPSPAQLEYSPFISSGFLERISVFVRGSMTVEAAFILPLVLCFCINLSSCIEMIRLHTRIESALTKVGDEVTICQEYCQSEVYVYARLISELGEEFISGSGIVGGALGIVISLENEDDVIRIKADYSIKPEISLVPFVPIMMENVYYGRVWTGYDPEENAEIVYVTRSGEVYHRDIGCRYISISVRRIRFSELEAHVNNEGQQYTLCKVCRTEEIGEYVYITDGGTKYHTIGECSAIKRNVYARAINDAAADHRPCTNCCIRDTVLT